MTFDEECVVRCHVKEKIVGIAPKKTPSFEGAVSVGGICFRVEPGAG